MFGSRGKENGKKGNSFFCFVLFPTTCQWNCFEKSKINIFFNTKMGSFSASIVLNSRGFQQMVHQVRLTSPYCILLIWRENTASVPLLDGSQWLKFDMGENLKFSEHSCRQFWVCLKEENRVNHLFLLFLPLKSKFALKNFNLQVSVKVSIILSPLILSLDHFFCTVFEPTMIA